MRPRAAVPLLLLALSACTTGSAPSGGSGADLAAERRADLDGLVRAVETLHPDPFGAIDESSWRADVAGLRKRARALTDDEFLVGVARLAVLGDRNGHGGVFPTDQEDLRFWPLRLYEFDEGWRVVDASDTSLVGARLDGIGGRSDPLMAVLRELAGDERISLRVLVGRGTYSAAALLFAELEADVPVTFYGEPTGGGSGTFGNPQAHRLPDAGITVQVPGRYFSRLATDIAAIEPDVPVETTWADLRAGRDPVLAAALVP